MFKNSLLAVTLLAAAASVARADDPETGTAMPPPVAASGEAFSKGTLGLSFPITLLSNFSGDGVTTGTAPVPTIGLLYFLDGNDAIDAIVGFNLHHFPQTTGAPPVTSNVTLFGFAVGAGYRMYKHKGKMHAFIEPRVEIEWGDVSISNAFDVLVGGDFGVERMISDWFSFSGAIGAGANFTNSFKDIDLSTEANLAANFYWQ